MYAIELPLGDEILVGKIRYHQVGFISSKGNPEKYFNKTSWFCGTPASRSKFISVNQIEKRHHQTNRKKSGELITPMMAHWHVEAIKKSHLTSYGEITCQATPREVSRFASEDQEVFSSWRGAHTPGNTLQILSCACDIIETWEMK